MSQTKRAATVAGLHGLSFLLGLLSFAAGVNLLGVLPLTDGAAAKLTASFCAKPILDMSLSFAAAQTQCVAAQSACEARLSEYTHRARGHR